MQLHLWGVIIWLNFTPEITKIQEIPGPPPGRYPEPNGGLKVATRPHAFEKKFHAPTNQNSWIRPW